MLCVVVKDAQERGTSSQLLALSFEHPDESPAELAVFPTVNDWVQCGLAEIEDHNNL